MLYIETYLCVFVVENLQNLLASGAREASPQTEGNQSPSLSLLPRRADTFGGYDSIPCILPKSKSQYMWLDTDYTCRINWDLLAVF